MTFRTAALALLLVGCGSPQPPTIARPEPQPGPPLTAPPAPPAPPAPAPPGVDATPDKPSADDAKRDAELAQKAADYIDAFSNFEPVLTRDGKRLVFASNRDGLAQLYVGEVANRPPHRSA